VKVCLDTNVLASGFATRGLCADVVREVLAGHELVVGAPLLSELRRVLTAKFGVPVSQASEIISLLRKDAVVGKPEPLPAIEFSDPDDLPVLACALSAHAELFVTGDKALLALRQVEGIPIISPREFWEYLKRAVH
jgi:putative PIN family toxin of toxin-antitoxin system